MGVNALAHRQTGQAHGKARSEVPPSVVGHLSVNSMSSDVILEEFEVQ